MYMGNSFHLYTHTYIHSCTVPGLHFTLYMHTFVIIYMSITEKSSSHIVYTCSYGDIVCSNAHCSGRGQHTV